MLSAQAPKVVAASTPTAQPVAPTTPAAIELHLPQPIRLQGNPGPNPLWNVLLSAVAALLGALIGSYSSTRNARAAIIQKTNELEIDSIERKLIEFVGPFMQLSEENRILAAELKRKQPQGAGFRTLTALLTPGWIQGLTKGDRHLLDAVVANGVALRRIISDRGASAVSPELMPYFSQASAHFRFLELAAADSLDPDPTRYSQYVYPRQLDGVMRAEQERLLARRATLYADPDRSHPPMPALVIAENLRLPSPDEPIPAAD